MPQRVLNLYNSVRKKDCSISTRRSFPALADESGRLQFMSPIIKTGPGRRNKTRWYCTSNSLMSAWKAATACRGGR